MSTPAKANPFRSKGDVHPEFVCGRQAELAELTRHLSAMRSCAVASSRRLGKTWLVRLALKTLAKEGFLTAYLDLAYVHAPLQWLEWYASAVLSAVARSPRELFGLVGRYLPGVGVESVDARPEGYRLRLRGHFTDADFQKVASEVYGLPERIARETRRKFVIALDEFPEVVAFLGLKDLARWRRQIQEARTVAYLLASARPVLNDRLFREEGAPLKDLVKTMRLEKIPKRVWEDFILGRFRRAGFRTDRETVSRLLDEVEGWSYYAQMACRHLYNARKDVKRLGPGDVAGLQDWILEHEDPYFEQVWRAIGTKPRQSLVAALAKEPSKQVFAADFRLTHRLPPASTLQAALKHLEDEGLVERQDGVAQVTDPMFRLWLVRQGT